MNTSKHLMFRKNLGEVEGRRQALEQAIALKPQGIVINGFDAKEQQTLIDLIDRANAQRIDIVGQ